MIVRLTSADFSFSARLMRVEVVSLTSSTDLPNCDALKIAR